jgi:hypothetical protein
MSRLGSLAPLLCLLVAYTSLPSPAWAGACPAHEPKPQCKAVPGTADWPSQQAWDRLDAALGRRLVRPPPPGAVCHPGQPTYDLGRCGAVNASWGTYDFHAADPVSVMSGQYSHDSCLPDPAHPCSDAGYPALVVNATTAEHVKLAVDFCQFASTSTPK